MKKKKRHARGQTKIAKDTNDRKKWRIINGIE